MHAAHPAVGLTLASEVRAWPEAASLTSPASRSSILVLVWCRACDRYPASGSLPSRERLLFCAFLRHFWGFSCSWRWLQLDQGFLLWLPLYECHELTCTGEQASGSSSPLEPLLISLVVGLQHIGSSQAKTLFAEQSTRLPHALVILLWAGRLRGPGIVAEVGAIPETLF